MTPDDAISAAIETNAARRKALRRLGLSPFTLSAEEIFATAGGTLTGYRAPASCRHTAKPSASITTGSARERRPRGSVSASPA